MAVQRSQSVTPCIQNVAEALCAAALRAIGCNSEVAQRPPAVLEVCE